MRYPILIAGLAMTGCGAPDVAGRYSCGNLHEMTLSNDGVATFRTFTLAGWQERKVPYELADDTTIQVFDRQGRRVAQVLRVDGVNIYSSERPADLCTKVEE